MCAQSSPAWWAWAWRTPYQVHGSITFTMCVTMMKKTSFNRVPLRLLPKYDEYKWRIFKWENYYWEAASKHITTAWVWLTCIFSTVYLILVMRQWISSKWFSIYLLLQGSIDNWTVWFSCQLQYLITRTSQIWLVFLRCYFLGSIHDVVMWN